MKEVIIMSSSPRVGGNSEILAQEFGKGATNAGHDVEFIYLRDHYLKYCIGCMSCQKTGECIHNDAMNTICQKLMGADAIVFATPVYFYSMSGQLKVFIDRLVPVYSEISSDIYIIASQMDESKEMMEKTIESIRGCTRDCFDNCREKGVIYGVGLNELGDAKNNLVLLKQAYEMGKNV